MNSSHFYTLFLIFGLVFFPISLTADESDEQTEPVAEQTTGDEEENKEDQEQIKKIKAEINRIALTERLIAARIAEQLRPFKLEMKSLQARMELATARQKARLHELQLEYERLSAQRQILQARIASSLETEESIKARMKVANERAQLQAEAELRALRKVAKNQVKKPMTYDVNPFKDGVLTITDRRIPLNGPIVSGTAKYITDRIHYFNNQSTKYPIFIVIDSCPGGSVMEGFRILKAMESSKAPIHVVVKSFAASMAAAITTLAEHSYAYPNAIILHHQISSGMRGNLTEQEEYVKSLRKWSVRLTNPIAKKMGIGHDEFIKRMYENTKTGDWEEFADDAKKLNWVQHIVKEVRELGVVSKPKDNAPRPSLFFFLKEEIGPEGKRFVRLPRLNPYDVYHIHNRDGYYRLR